jgi:hypothetical protein
MKVYKSGIVFHTLSIYSLKVEYCMADFEREFINRRDNCCLVRALKVFNMFAGAGQTRIFESD